MGLQATQDQRSVISPVLSPSEASTELPKWQTLSEPSAKETPTSSGHGTLTALRILMRCIKESRTHRNYTEGKRSSCLFKLKKKVPIYFYNIQWHFLYPRGILFRAEKKRVSLAFKKLMHAFCCCCFNNFDAQRAGDTSASALTRWHPSHPPRCGGPSFCPGSGG